MSREFPAKSRNIKHAHTPSNSNKILQVPVHACMHACMHACTGTCRILFEFDGVCACLMLRDLAGNSRDTSHVITLNDRQAARLNNARRSCCREVPRWQQEIHRTTLSMGERPQHGQVKVLLRHRTIGHRTGPQDIGQGHRT